MTRVLSTEQAKASIQQIQRTIAGPLLEQIRTLDAHGRTLSDPNVWDGVLASEFRGSVWPQTKAALDRLHSQLEELRARIEVINDNIMTAGGNR
ncbi:MAG TPA: hypothetical protein VGA69_03615 [Nitriliruptorales bacterium]